MFITKASIHLNAKSVLGKFRKMWKLFIFIYENYGHVLCLLLKNSKEHEWIKILMTQLT